MTHSTLDPVLRRKIVQRAPAPQTTEAGRPAVDDGPAGALVRSFARAVSDTGPLVAEGGKRVLRRLKLAELLDSIDPESYVALIGSEGATGIALVDQSGFTAIVEAMTTGRLSKRPVVGRRATMTDAALLGEVLNATLTGLGSDDPARPCQIQRSVPDHRMLPIVLDDVDYWWVSLEVSVVCGDVKREARIALALPVEDRSPDKETGPGETSIPAEDAAWQGALEASVLAAPATLRAELGRLTLALSEVLELGVGSTLTLPLSNLEEVRLAALDGQVHAMGRLGQSRGMRAVRLTSWPTGAPPETDARFQPSRGGEAPTPAPLAVTGETKTQTAKREDEPTEQSC